MRSKGCQLEEHIDEICRDLDQDELPGVAVGIAAKGKPIYRKGFGLANMELPVRLAPDMRMRIGSITKQFASLVYLRLCEEGRAGIDDAVGRHVPNLPPAVAGVTIRHLMTHTSGLPDMFEVAWRFSGIDCHLPSSSLVDLYRSVRAADARPGTRWRYNNGGYALIGAAIEHIADQALETVLLERVLEPAGMGDSLLRRNDSDFIPNSATLHMGSAADGFSKRTIGSDLGAEGGMVSTIDDMLRWLDELARPSFGAASSWKALATPLVLANGTATGYGLGLAQMRYDGVQMLGHAGGVYGGNAQMLKLCDADLDIVVISNRHDISASELGFRLVDALVPQSRASCPERPVVNGLYRSEQSQRIIHMFGQDGRQRVAIDGSEVPMVAHGGQWLKPARAFSYRAQSMAWEGDEPATIEFDDFGNAARLSLCRSAGRFASLPQARFVAEGWGLGANIYATGAHTILRTTGHFGSTDYRLTPLALNVWQAEGFSGEGVLYRVDSDSFTFATPRLSPILFRKLD